VEAEHERAVFVEILLEVSHPGHVREECGAACCALVVRNSCIVLLIVLNLFKRSSFICIFLIKVPEKRRDEMRGKFLWTLLLPILKIEPEKKMTTQWLYVFFPQ
jgi:hypothetical protein